MKNKFIWVCTLLISASVQAQPALEIPLSCELGGTCFIVDLYDHGRGFDESRSPYMMDYTGGKRTTDDHYGTRFQIYNSRLANEGAIIMAAADGVVTSVRNKMPSDPYAVSVLGSRLSKSVGNSVVVDHGNGWETQYNGMMQDSIPVVKGDTVKVGQTLGKIERHTGLNYPSMQFVVRHKSIPVDPFVGLYEGMFNKGMERKPLWKNDFEETAFTKDVGLVATGFSKEVPDIELSLIHI